MKLIVGLGNPGERYRQTIHNVGFEVVDALARKHGASWDAAPAEALIAKVRGMGDDVVLLAKPLTFMNLSGRAVGDLQRYFKIPLDGVLVIVDDVNLPAGQLRVRRGGSAGGHNGLKSIIECVGTDQFARVRVGVGRGDPRRELKDHVLGRVPPDLRDALETAVTAASEAAELFVTDSLAEVMNRFNRRQERVVEDGDTGAS
jgi:PTH1 family peptidyl-tRNA hydrolase